MMVRGSTPSLIQGISQQTPTLRLPAYLEDGLNIYPSVIEGLTRRPAEDFISNLPGLVAPTAQHWIDRDEEERYLVVADEGELKVFDFDGVEKTVNAPDGWSYISGASSLGFKTINDYTFVYDRGKVVAMAATTEPGTAKSGLAFVRQGDYATTYTLSLGYPVGSPSWSSVNYTTSASSASDIKPDNVAAALFGALTTAGLNATYSYSVVGSVIHISRIDGNDFLLTVQDSATNKNMVAVKDYVDSFNNLPTIAPDGFHIGIRGDEGNPKDDWFAKFVRHGGAGFGAGYWQESPKAGELTELDPATMPHVLVRESDGTFTFREAEWGKRVCGSEVNQSKPSFVGQKIEAMGAIKQRVWATAGRNFIATRPADPFNFWLQSAQQLLDSDPIDIAPSHDQPFVLKGAGEFQRGIILFADNIQFRVTHGEIFGPKTIATAPLSKFDLSVRNGLLGLQQDRVMCAVTRRTHAGMMAFKTPSTNLADMIFDETSAVVPKLMPGTAEWVAGSATENTVVMKTSGSNYLFAYKEAEDQGKIIQSAWVPWEFKGREPVSGTFVGPDLYLFTKDDNDKYALGRISLRPYASGQLAWDIYLDRRVELDEDAFVASGATTTVTMPYEPTEDEVPLLVVSQGPQAGAVMKAISVDGNEVVFPGLHDGPAVVGVVARSFAQLSTLFWRKPADNGGLEVIVEGTLQLLRGKVSYAQSGPFKVNVLPHDRETGHSTSIAMPFFEETYFQSPQNLRTGSTEFPIGALNDRVKITFDTEESPMPMRIGSFEWWGDLSIPAKPL